MPSPRRHWTQYPPQVIALAKLVATASLPIVFDGAERPFSRSDALSFRQAFNRFREVLRVSTTTDPDGANSYPARLSEMLETISVKVKPSPDSLTKYYVVFDTHPIVAEMDRLDPAAAQVRELSRAQFIAAQRPSPLSTPIFSFEEMQERLDDISKV